MPNNTPDDIIKEIVNWTAAKLRIWDDPLYTINKLENTLKVTFRLTRFLNYRVSYGTVPDELAVAVATHGVSELSHNFETLLPKRKKYLGSLEAFLDFPNRLCVGGAIVLFAAKTDDNDVAVVLFAFIEGLRWLSIRKKNSGTSILSFRIWILRRSGLLFRINFCWPLKTPRRIRLFHLYLGFLLRGSYADSRHFLDKPLARFVPIEQVGIEALFF